MEETVSGLPVRLPLPEVNDPVAFDQFSCNVNHDNPDTPDRLRPDVRIVRQFSNGFRIRMHDGRDIRFWGFYDPDDSSEVRKRWPSKPVRVREGQIVHLVIKSGKNTHTIHMHGIDPTPSNDGVGHTSFEVTGEYTYQFQPQYPGTYSYHCHKNTALHFELGMYGLLLVEPAIPFHESGRRFAFNPHPDDRTELMPEDYLYDVEAAWVFDDVDPRWHELGHNAGLCQEDAGLNIIDPKYFLITGVPSHLTRTDSRVVARVQRGQTLLTRVFNASYGFLDFTIDPPPGVRLDGLILEADGRVLRHNPTLGEFAFPIPYDGSPLEFVTSQRNTILLRNLQPGIYTVRGVFRDWLAQRPVGEAITRIEVA